MLNENELLERLKELQDSFDEENARNATEWNCNSAIALVSRGKQLSARQITWLIECMNKRGIPLPSDLVPFSGSRQHTVVSPQKGQAEELSECLGDLAVVVTRLKEIVDRA